MGAQRKDNAVKDAETFRIKLDPIKRSAIAISTGAANGANVVFKAYLGINGVRYGQPVEMLKPDNSTAAVTDLTGAGKLGVIPLHGMACTDLWIIRTDADPSTDATVFANVTAG